jgi:DNA invertase Pin-like site-specific DNA recombinase
MREEKIYRAGVYLRLSREDGGFAWSNSIQSQRELAVSFVHGRSDIRIVDFYVDDGYSGISFKRPGFCRLLEDVQAGLVDCIIVKDLSRFGRDYIEAGRLIQKTFPALNVRFIAITDRFDSLTAGYNEFSLVVPVKNFVNDSYCRDISGKVRSHQRVKREKGEFIGAFAVYGYCRDPQKKNRLVADDYAAFVVRDIFRWRLEGMSSTAIAKELNEYGILSPMEYKKIRGENYSTGFALREMGKWSAMAVRRILTNEIYLGTMVQGKTEKINYKLTACQKKPKEEWIRVAGTHEPLIAERDFRAVQELLLHGARAIKGQKKAHPFSGVLFCGDCGRPMVRRMGRRGKEETIYFMCSAKNAGRGCTRHRIAETELEAKVTQALKAKAGEELEALKGKAMGELEALKGKAEGALEADCERHRLLRREIERLCDAARECLNRKGGLYGDWKRGVISQEDLAAFSDFYEKRYQGIREAAERQGRLLKELMEKGEKDAPAGRRLLQREALSLAVERISVYEGGEVFVRFREEGSHYGG